MNIKKITIFMMMIYIIKFIIWKDNPDFITVHDSTIMILCFIEFLLFGFLSFIEGINLPDCPYCRKGKFLISEDEFFGETKIVCSNVKCQKRGIVYTFAINLYNLDREKPNEKKSKEPSIKAD